MAGLCALGAHLLAGCKDAAQPAGTARSASAPERTEVELVPVQRREVPRSVDVTGTIYGAEEAVISAKVPGRVAIIAADVGDVVPPGAVLARLEPRDFELAVEQRRTALQETLAALALTELPAEDFDIEDVPTVVRARVEAANAKARHDRAHQLLEQEPPLISAQDYADIRTAWEVAQSVVDVARLEARARLAEARSRAADLSLAEQRLADATIRAPIADDVQELAIAARQVSVGEYVREGDPLFRTLIMDPVKFRGDAPERFVARIREGQPARLGVEAWSIPFEGRVTRVSPQVNPRSRTFPVEITVPNPEGRLRPGSFATASIVTHMEADVPFVPSDAVVTFAGVEKIFTVEDGKAVEHRVRTGSRIEVGGITLVELVDAPADLTEVVSRGAARLATGIPVQVVNELAG